MFFEGRLPVARTGPLQTEAQPVQVAQRGGPPQVFIPPLVHPSGDLGGCPKSTVRGRTPGGLLLLLVQDGTAAPGVDPVPVARAGGALLVVSLDEFVDPVTAEPGALGNGLDGVALCLEPDDLPTGLLLGVLAGAVSGLQLL